MAVINQPDSLAAVLREMKQQIDALRISAASGAVPIGAQITFARPTSDPAYMLCNGGTFDGARYPQLAVFLGGTTPPNVSGWLTYIRAL